MLRKHMRRFAWRYKQKRGLRSIKGGGTFQGHLSRAKPAKAAFVGDDIEEPGNASAWTPLMARLVRIARRRDAAVLLLHHALKSDGAYRDSTAIGAAVDVILELRPDEQNAMARRLRTRGRFQVPDTTVCLEDTGFTLASGEIPRTREASEELS
jgi:hypothetical protein